MSNPVIASHQAGPGLPHRQAGPLKEKINIPYLPLETANPWKEKVIFQK
jgi:hypothetical protein